MAEDWDSSACAVDVFADSRAVCIRCSTGRVCGRNSHLGCWLAVEMGIDGRLRQGKALSSICEIPELQCPLAHDGLGLAMRTLSVT